MACAIRLFSFPICSSSNRSRSKSSASICRCIGCDLPVRAKLRSLYPISAVSEPSSGIVCGNGLECFGDGLIQSFLAASFGGTEELFELRPSLLDGVQGGRVGR